MVKVKQHRMFCRSGALAANAKAGVRGEGTAPTKFHSSGWASAQAGYMGV